MKKALSLLTVVILLLSFAPLSLALNYQRTLGNEATFETMGEVKANAPAAMAAILGGNYASHPVMADYPDDTTYVYRSADMFGRNAAVRLNTNLVVFTDQVFENKDKAHSYLTDLGIISLVDEAKGSAVLITPADGKAFAAADARNYYALQTAMFAQGASRRENDQVIRFADCVYYGGYSFYYVIGIDGGASFVNNRIAGSVDYVSRIGGMLLLNGNMDRVREVASPVPVYLVNAKDDIVKKYCRANAVDSFLVEGDKRTDYSHLNPLQKVISLTTKNADAASLVQDAYYGMFIKAQRGQALFQGLNSADTIYKGYTNDQAPYSLCARNAMLSGVTADGIYEFTVVDDVTFADIKTDKGEYLQTWYEYLPEEIVSGQAAPHSIPLILTNHGGGDDPRQFVDGNGFMELAGKERLAMVAPYHQSMGYGPSRESADGSVLHLCLPKLVQHMLDKYPALDPSRVYVTGYSMGSGATVRSIYGNASLFAAAAPQAAGRIVPTDEMATQMSSTNLPVLFTCSEHDMAMLYVFDPVESRLGEGYEYMLDLYLGFNNMDPLPERDFDKYPITGFGASTCTYTRIHNEYDNYQWLFNTKEGIPMVGLNITMGLVHALYPPYAELCWNFMKHYSRNTETGEIIYNPYVR